MINNGKIMTMNSGNAGDGINMFLIYGKNNPLQNPNNENTRN
jgi:hypothetical protein